MLTIRIKIRDHLQIYLPPNHSKTSTTSGKNNLQNPNERKTSTPTITPLLKKINNTVLHYTEKMTSVHLKFAINI